MATEHGDDGDQIDREGQDDVAPADTGDPGEHGHADDRDHGDGRPARHRVVLRGVSSRTWEHPADRGALVALRELRGFDEVLKGINALWNERAWRLQFLGASVRVDHRQYARVHRLFAEAGSALDMPELPELYVMFDAYPKGSCVGMAKPFIVITRACVDLFDDDELRFLLGHELGHLLSGHAVYNTMLRILTGFLRSLSWLPLGAIPLRVVIGALLEWHRKAELSADRAGLLAGQDPAAALRTHMKLAGGGDLADIDTAAFLDQAAEYDKSGDLRESLMKIQLLLGRSHPLPVARAAELRRWVESGVYARILGGEYPRREDDVRASVSDEVKAAVRSYRDAFDVSQDPLISTVRRLGDGAADLRGWATSGAGRVRDWMTGRGGEGSTEESSAPDDTPETPGDAPEAPGSREPGDSQEPRPPGHNDRPGPPAEPEPRH